MIPVKTDIVEEGNLPGEEVFATIGDPRMVMKSLTKLYSNTALATIREYSTNARDSNVEAGRADVPIEVTLPTVLSPYFVVKDTGIGLDEKGLKEIYISYGTSTKRESNDFNGMLGYGSKSALAYTNMFTVTAVKDGIRTIAVITRKQDYSVALKVVSKAKTADPNGVEIKVPVQDHASFRRIALDFYRFWEPGTVNVDGASPEQAVGEKIQDGLYYSKNQGTSYVVMGNVGYRIANPEALFQNKNMKSISFVAYVPNGSVEFTPSREDLEYSEMTKKTLNGIIEVFEKKMVAQARKEISGAKDNFEAYSKWIEWSNRLGNIFNDIDFGGNKFTRDVPLTKKGMQYDLATYRRYNTDPLRNLTVAEVNSAFLVTDLTAIDLNSTHKAKAKEYIAQEGIAGVRKIYFVWEPINNQWLDPKRVVSWKDLLAALPKKPRVKSDGGTGRIPGSFDYMDENGTWHYGQPIPDKGKVFWISVQATKGNFNTYNVIKHLNFKKASIIVLGANRIEKFKRENPNVQNFKEYAVSKVNLNGEDFLTDEAKMVLELSNMAWSDIVTKFQDDRIIDPEWKAAGEGLAKKSTLMLDYTRAINFATACGKRWEFKQYSPTMTKAKSPFMRRYPMLEHVRYNLSSMREDIILYMNAAYVAREGKNV